MREHEYTCMISVIVPVYNTSEYLDEMLKSIIGQKQPCNLEIPFLELLLVDDGSTDSSGEMIDQYSRQFPWIKVIHQNNQGVSAARNAGLAAAGGKYINFTDSDDRLADNMLISSYEFMEAHYEEIDFTAVPVVFFEGRTGEHWTNTKFRGGNRVIDCMKEYDKPVYFSTAGLLKASYFRQEGFRFDTDLISGEDARLMNTILLMHTCCYGVITDTCYWYRRRENALSAVQTSNDKPQKYLPYLDKFLNVLIDMSKARYGRVLPFVKYTVMGQMQFLFKEDPEGTRGRQVIGEEAHALFRSKYVEILSQIDDEIIMAQPRISKDLKQRLLAIKKNRFW